MTRTVRVQRSPYGENEAEAAFQSWVIGMAETLGWLIFHDTDARMDRPGFPDLVLSHPVARRTLFVELKRRTGTLRTEQKRWRDSLLASGVEFQVWRPDMRPYALTVLDWEQRGVRVNA